MSVSLEGIGLLITIIASSIGVAAYVTTHLTEIKTDVKHAFKRLDALEEASKHFKKKRK